MKIINKCISYVKNVHHTVYNTCYINNDIIVHKYYLQQQPITTQQTTKAYTQPYYIYEP